METGRARQILNCLRHLAPPGGGLTDGQLLGRYLAHRDDAAFEALVRRHGPMVYGVCKRVLGHAQDAEDAFQAAFVVLARKAARVGDREAVAGWLFRVAYRAALEARAARLRSRERQVENMPQPAVMPKEDQADLLALLDRELARLPESHRLPLVLCELEGRSRKEAAKQLGLAEGTLSSRLARGRKMLARRLAAHGTAVTAAAVAAFLAGGARAAAVPGSLVVSTIGAAGGAVPAGVAALAKGVMKAMLLTKLKSVGWGLLLAASLAAGALVVTYRTATAQPASRADPAAAKAASDRDELEALRLEVEALRLELKATKERVRALEDEGQAQKRRADAGAPPGMSGMPMGGGMIMGRMSGGMGMPGASGLGGPPGGAAVGGPTLPGGAPMLGGPAAGGPPAGVPPGAGGPGAGPGGFTPGAGPAAGAPAGPGAAFPGAGPGLGSASGPPGGEASPDPAAEVDAALKKVRQHPDDKQALEELEHAVQRLKERGPQNTQRK